MLKYCVVRSELEKFNSYIDIASSMEIQNINIVVEKPSKQLNELYPNIASAVTTFNGKIYLLNLIFDIKDMEKNSSLRLQNYKR